MKIRCTTLFDITKTGVSGRRGLLDGAGTFSKTRSQQTNLDTILQVVSLRSQPEDITDPEKITLGEPAVFGKNYGNLGNLSAWTFSFRTTGNVVFTDHSGDQLGLLIQDCTGVPMITGLDELPNLTNKLSFAPDDCNIVFEVENE